jgi:hypothetical protein
MLKNHYDTMYITDLDGYLSKIIQVSRPTDGTRSSTTENHGKHGWKKFEDTGWKDMENISQSWKP